MKKILIIDDDEGIRHSLSLFFKLKGFDCSCAGDGVDGFDMYQSINPDILIIDYRMPKLNGCELIKRIRGIDEATPIILCSADKFLNTFDLDYPLVEIVKKPFLLQGLMEKISGFFVKATL